MTTKNSTSATSNGVNLTAPKKRTISDLLEMEDDTPSISELPGELRVKVLNKDGTTGRSAAILHTGPLAADDIADSLCDMQGSLTCTIKAEAGTKKVEASGLAVAQAYARAVNQERNEKWVKELKKLAKKK